MLYYCNNNLWHQWLCSAIDDGLDINLKVGGGQQLLCICSWPRVHEQAVTCVHQAWCVYKQHPQHRVIAAFHVHQTPICCSKTTAWDYLPADIRAIKLFWRHPCFVDYLYRPDMLRLCNDLQHVTAPYKFSLLLLLLTSHACKHQQVPLSRASWRARLAVTQFGAQPTRNLRDWTSPASIISDVLLASREDAKGTTLRWTREPITGCNDRFLSTKPLGIFTCSASINSDSFGFEIWLWNSDTGVSFLPAAIKWQNLRFNQATTGRS